MPLEWLNEPKLLVETWPQIEEDPSSRYWRAESFVSLDRDGNPERATVYLDYYPVIDETEKTVLLGTFIGKKRVHKFARKRYAYPTKAGALDSWKHRFNWRKMYAQREMARIEILEQLIKECLNE